MPNLPSCTEYISAIECPMLIKAETLKGGIVERNSYGKVRRYTGGFCVVFPFLVGTKRFAVRCWHASVEKIKERTRLVSEFLKTSKLPYFAEFDYYTDGIATSKGVMPIVIMDWLEGKPLKVYIKEHLHDRESIRQLARQFYDMMTELHRHQISHGDLQHGNILVMPNGKIKLVDYDSMFVPGLEGYDDEIKGLKGYQHPARFSNEKVSYKTDYFSELIIYTSLIALSNNPDLWYSTQMENTEYMLFSEEDLNELTASNIFNQINSDEETNILCQRITSFLNESSIDTLSPIEEIVQPPMRIDEKLHKAWQTNGYTRPLCTSPDPKDIHGKWTNQPAQKAVDYTKQIDKITKKW